MRCVKGTAQAGRRGPAQTTDGVTGGPALLGFYTTRSATLLAVSTRVGPAPNKKEPLCSGSFPCLQIAQSD